MWLRIQISIIFLLYNIMIIKTITLNELKSWLEHVSKPNTKCPLRDNSISSDLVPKISMPILEVTNCDSEDDIVNYDFKLMGGKKPKRGILTGGYGTITIGNGGKFGIKSKKCLKVGNRDIQIVRGEFINNNIEGHISLTFMDKTSARGFAQNGKMVDIITYFDSEGRTLNITDLYTGKSIKMYKNPAYFVSDLYKTEHGMRSLFYAEGMENVYNCIQIDDLFFAQCHMIENFENIQIKGCNLDMMEKDSVQISNNNIDKPTETFNIIVGEKIVQAKEESEFKFPCHDNEGELNSSTRTSLETWIKDITDPNLLWDHFTKSFSPIDEENPEIDILFPMFVDRPKFNNSAVTIETLHGKTLFHGKLRNGHLKGKVPTEKIDHPGWRTRLKIILDRYNYGRHDSNNIIGNSGPNTNHQGYFIQGTLKNGKLHGLVQMYGIFPIDTNGICSEYETNGLSFIGYYENGIPSGPCWRKLVGGAWMYGILDENRQFTGKKDIAYIYPDLELLMVGQYKKGLLVEGQEAQISEEICNEHGIKRLKFSDPHGPYFYYDQPTNKSFGDQPNLRDPLDKKYMYLKNSNIFPGAGEGAFATRDVPADTIFSPYGGMLYTWKQREILDEKHNKTRLENGWNDDDEKSVALYKYRHNMKCGETTRVTIDIAPEFEPTSNYQGTLGHKVNHDFRPNSKYVQLETPRFGVINAVKTIKPIKKDEEYFASYGYPLANGPKWYRELYINKFFNSTSDNTDEAIKSIESSEDLLQNQGKPIVGLDASSFKNEL